MILIETHLFEMIDLKRHQPFLLKKTTIVDRYWQWMLLRKRLRQVGARVDECLVLGYRQEEVKELKPWLEKLEAKITG